MFEGLVGLALFMALALLQLPLALAMGLVGFCGFAYKVSPEASLAMVTQITYETALHYPLTVIPLFILMGNFVARAGLTQELFGAAYVCLGHRRGGLAMSTVVACAGFGAICGSSVATSATFARVAYDPMRHFQYERGLAAGTIAAGGTLGILIPPSVVLVLYAIMTDTSIGKLFAAGLIPGLVTTVLFCLAIYIVGLIRPSACPAATNAASWSDRLRALRKVWPVAVLFILVMGGIYLGVFTATEGAAVGAAGGFLLALLRKALALPVLVEVVAESARTTAMIFMLLIGAIIFSNFINLTTMPKDLLSLTSFFKESPASVIVAIIVIYIILGTVMEEVSMMLLTVPMFFPIVVATGFDPIWFGVIIVNIVMLGMISPPVGMNIFVVRSLLPEVSTIELFRGVIPFVIALCILPIILILFPQLATWLPSFVK